MHCTWPCPLPVTARTRSVPTANKAAAAFRTRVSATRRSPDPRARRGESSSRRHVEHIAHRIARRMWSRARAAPPRSTPPSTLSGLASTTNADVSVCACVSMQLCECAPLRTTRSHSHIRSLAPISLFASCLLTCLQLLHSTSSMPPPLL